jgi:hypothetical protein
MMTFSFNRQALLLRTDFSIAGAGCVLSTNSEEVLQAAERWNKVQPRAQTNSFEMDIFVEAALDMEGMQRAHFRGLRHLVWVALPPRGLITYDLLRRRVRAVLTSRAAGDLAFWDSLLLPVTIGILGTTMGVAPLHCACLDRGGSALLVAGASGAGKSTLAAALGKRGFALVSDDWTYLTLGEAGLIAHGLAAPIKLLPDTTRFFSELGKFALRVTLNGEEAYEVDARRELGFAVKEMTEPKWVFFLERSKARGCRMIPCRAEYVKGFFEHCAERLPEELPQAKVSRSKVIQKLSERPAWILHTGESPQGTAAAVDHFLAEKQNEYA